MENLEWKDKVDGQDDILAEDINAIAKYANNLNGGKVDKENGKKLSSNDFTNGYKSMLDNAGKGEISPINDNLATSSKVFDFVLDVMPPQITVDDKISKESTNPVQNKIIAEALDDVEFDVSAMDNYIEKKTVNVDNVSIENQDEENLTGEIGQVNSVWLPTEKYQSDAPHTLYFKDTKARKQIANIPMQKIFEVTTTEVTDSIKDNALKNLKLDDVYVCIRMPSALSSASAWSCTANGITTPDGYLYYFVPNTTGKCFVMRAERMSNGLWFSQKFSNLSGSHDNADLISSYLMTGIDYINELKITCTGLPAGSTVTVCGRKVLN